MGLFDEGFTAGFTETFAPAFGKGQQHALESALEKQKLRDERAAKDALINGIVSGDRAVIDRMSVFTEGEAMLNSRGLKFKGSPFSKDLDIVNMSQNEFREFSIQRGGVSPQKLTEPERKKFLTPEQREKLQKERVLGRIGLGKEEAVLRKRITAEEERGKAVVPGPEGGFVAGMLDAGEQLGPEVAESVEERIGENAAASLNIALEVKGVEIDPTKKEFALRDIKTKEKKSITPSQALTALKSTDSLGRPLMPALEAQIPGATSQLQQIVNESIFSDAQQAEINRAIKKFPNRTRAEVITALQKKGLI